MARYGMTIPMRGVPLAEHRDWLREMVDLGYTDFWSSEAGAHDGFTPLALAAAWAPEARLGIAIVPAYTRGPALLAMSVASLAEAAPGRFVMGIGTSSNVIVERWNGVPFEEPYARVRDSVRFLKRALAGEKVDEEYPSFSVRGYRLQIAPPDPPPPILVGALRQGMLKLAGRVGDGAILNWLSAEDVRTVTPFVHAGGEGKEIVARLFVCPTTDREVVRAVGRRAIAAYLTVPVYAAFHEWLGRRDQLAGLWRHWEAGDRKAALETIPDEVIDELIIHGTPEACREHVARYVEAGVDTPVLSIMHADDLRMAVRDLAPRSQ
ncbi:MAG: LLM class F420-dependent oxidoreductase [Deltaproteobacteria bacterium]|jgi:probable F420-dependent oxidoreductase|nr:LLM class F420-dependent oxidoreductase [Deltaproteobacteria bacterium]MBW2497847.1 LLM class F420-dependent oxidoreductase [Deltaproteobacteria bacterium]